jgi:hypothetical protein
MKVIDEGTGKGRLGEQGDWVRETGLGVEKRD